jgi:membrane protease YdiL (CAAX protease family)
MKNPLTSLLVTIAGVAVVTPLVIYGARNPELAAIYPRIDNLSSSPLLFVRGSFFYFLYYVGYEICFRGFLFMGVRDDVGDVQALLVSLAVTVMLHLTQPQIETLMAVLAGFAFPIIVLRLRNVWPAVLIHAYVGISLNYWIIVYGGGFPR